ncbi:MAG TPA: ThuA domain-containing protein [Kineosporiaceae bacterium]|nr:ThuA domain-containing protein [Kineosporiaceae bacterium]
MLVVGGRWHDMDFARLQLLQELDKHDRVRVRVFENYASAGALERADALITYTCEVRPEPEEQQALVDFVSGGGRWLALHATNSVLDPVRALDPVKAVQRLTFRAPRVLGPVAQVLGSQFLAHPPIAPYVIEVVGDDPLVAGLEPFTTTDELYICELHPPLRVLLQTHYSGSCRGFEEGQWDDDAPRPVLYRKVTGEGEVCYFTLGHCRGRYDVRDLGIEDLGKRDRGSWQTPEFRQVLSRTLAWAAYGDAWPNVVY